ncbi:hypothetical protein [Chromohalobacter canadensis]|uniref:hypothetical protein n=1 Tax=Chromohalobacter canadensis TaxID=141389 RepID=UPI00240EF191|nr:hypothetical protein [Chromohalobacter canadensis]
MDNTSHLVVRRGVKLFPLGVFLTVFAVWLLLFLFLGIHHKPAAGDETDYINRGIEFFENGWSALSDGWRPPLLPLLIAFFNIFVDTSSLLNLARMTNIAFVSMVPALWSYEYMVSGKRKKYLLMAMFTSAWPAYYLLAFSVYAEAASFLFLNILIIITLRMKNSDKFLALSFIGFPLCLAVLFLFKANNILISVPFGLYILFFGAGSFAKRFFRVSALALITVMMISPWLVFLKSEMGDWVATTTGGYNLLVGTGHHSFGMAPDNEAIHREYLLNAYGGEFPEISSEEVALINSQPSKYLMDKVSKDIAFRIWSEDTKRMLNLSFRKVMHSHGMSFRGAGDFIVFSFLLVSIAASVVLLYKNKFVDIVFLHWSMALAGGLLLSFGCLI